MKQCDIIIVGGGMVGASFAAALGPHGFSIAIVEPFEFKPFEVGEPYDIRVSALTRATEKVYRLIGAWDEMEKARLAPYEQMHVWDSTGSGRIDFDCADIGQPNLGHIVENRVILSSLRKVVAQFEQIELISPARGVELKQDEQSVTLTLDSGEELKAPLLVATDGANSWVRDQVGITTTGWSYDQTAVVATVPLAFWSLVARTPTPTRAGN